MKDEKKPPVAPAKGKRSAGQSRPVLRSLPRPSPAPQTGAPRPKR